MKDRRIPILIVSWLFTLPLLGAQLSPQLESEAKEIETMLIAPCCWTQPVSEHYSAAADQIRTEVRQMLASGMTRDQILQKYVAEYGQRILSKPPARGFNSLVYFLPVLFLIAGAGVAVLVVRRLRPASAPTEPPAAQQPGSKYSSQLDKEMWG
jgi:cytochrome c-type biogenesis protein CcmH